MFGCVKEFLGCIEVRSLTCNLLFFSSPSRLPWQTELREMWVTAFHGLGSWTEGANGEGWRPRLQMQCGQALLAASATTLSPCALESGTKTNPSVALVKYFITRKVIHA